MWVLNLDPLFNPIIGYPMGITSLTFPSKLERHVKLNGDYAGLDKRAMIVARIRSSDDIMDLLLATDALRRLREWDSIELFIPYLPYARQDRVCAVGEALSIKVFADLINSQGYRQVHVFDVHSDVALALINNVRNIDPWNFIKQCIYSRRIGSWTIAPDAGAQKKFNKWPVERVVLCTKHRDFKNGGVMDIKVHHDDLEGKDCYIIDDICSKGGTFIGIAKELRKKNAGNVYLVVSHYEDSADRDELSKHLNGIYCTNSMGDIEDDRFITQKRFLRDIWCL